jgi:N-acetylglucosamine-6-phosphate deacetylase
MDLTPLRSSDSVASSDVAVASVTRGARLITHLFNAMPQLHHRDPSIIGLLGAKPPPPAFLESPKTRYSPYTSPYGGQTPVTTGDDGSLPAPMAVESKLRTQFKSEAFSETSTPASKVHSTPATASMAMTKIVLESAAALLGGKNSPTPSSLKNDGPTKTTAAPRGFQKPYYDMIVDGIHSHPNSVRVS